MELEARVAELQNKAQEMAKYYYKGFGSNLSGILVNAEAYSRGIGKRDYSETAYKRFEKIESFYATIPFENLKGKEEYYPLFVVKSLLTKVRKNIDAIFKEKNAYALADLEMWLKAVKCVGDLYFFSLKQVFEELRAIPGNEDFDILIRDRNGQTWSLARYLLFIKRYTS